MDTKSDKVLKVTTPELWPLKAREILKSKNVDVSELQEMFTHIAFPWDNVYNTERVYFSLRIEQRPLFIVKPCCVSEIEKILNYVRLKNVTVRIMNGRHSSALVHSEVLVDMSAFRNRELNDDREGTLVAGAGNTQGSLNDFLFNQHSREMYSHFGSFIHPRVQTDAFPGGSAATVGCAGISTVGGVGTLCRTYGLTVDSVIEYKITVPPTDTRKSKTIIATKKSHPGLYWALRGGMGSNFGIVSEISFGIIEVPEIIRYSVEWEWSAAVRVLEGWSVQSLNRPIQFNEDLAIAYNPDTRKLIIHLTGYYVLPSGQSESRAYRIIHKQLDTLGGELKIQPKIKYSELYTSLVIRRRYFNFSIIQTMFTDRVTAELVIRFFDLAKVLNLPGPVSLSYTLLGGKISEIPPEATAFYPRERNFFIDLAVAWDTFNENQIMERWTNKIVKRLVEIEGTIVYVGFPITFTNIKYTDKIYYGGNYSRLQVIKEKYDPLNILTSCGTIRV